MVKMAVLLCPFVAILFEIFGQSISSMGDRNGVLSMFMASWMISWWIFEIVPLGITAFIPVIFLPLFGVLSIKEVSAFYANSVIYLFIGGFLIARGLEKTGLSERIALQILKFTAKSAKGIIIGFVLATGFLSMWISNTATTVMMVPIALSVINFIRDNSKDREQKNIDAMAIALFLAIAYSANIGGFTTPVGTPPNVVFLGFLNEIYGIKIDFYSWMLVSVPLAAVLCIAMLKLLWLMFPFQVRIDSSFREFVFQKLDDLGPTSKEQKITLYIFAMVCGLWIFKDLVHELAGHDFLNDTSIAILGGSLLFLIPVDVRKKNTILSVEDISTLPWNIVLLFGGGMALTGTFEKVGILSDAESYFTNLPVGSPYLVAFIITALALLLTEVMSNVALCMVLLPLVMSFATANGLDPFVIGFPVAVSSSLAFSMPIATPPNAIVFATNYVKLQHMLKIGLLMNVVGIMTIMSLGWYLLKLLF